MNSETVRVGVVGAGGLANSMHLPALKEIENAEIVAICDLVEERAQRAAAKFAIPRTYILYPEMLEKEELDAVFVLVNPFQLTKVVLDALDAGKDVYMEKPPGITGFQADTLVRKAEESQRFLQVGFNRRYIPLVQRVLEEMRKLTTITYVEGTFFKHGTAAFDGGHLSSFVSDTIHVVDLVRYISGGEPSKASTIQKQVADVVPNAWYSVIEFDNGVTGVVKANYMTGGRIHKFEVHGPEASAFIDLGFGPISCRAEILIYGGKTAYSISAAGAQKRKLMTFDGFELAGSKEMYRFYGFFQEDQAFINSVLSRTPPICDIADAAKSMHMTEFLLANQLR